MNWTFEDLLSGERLQALADATIITPPILAFHRSLRQSAVSKIVQFPGTHRQMEPDRKSVAQLRGCRSIFVYTHLLPSFVERVLPLLDQRFVLISHNSDDCIDARFLPLLDDPRLVHWYAQNAVVNHPCLTPLPIGIANAQWPHGKLDELISVCSSGPSARRDIVYSNFDVSTNPKVRAPLLSHLSTLPFVWQAPARPFREYLTDMAACHWCISPPGNGVDCHRTWEALYLGVTPIVQRTAWGGKLHDPFPVVQVDSYEGLSLDLLNKQSHAYSARRFDLAPLSLGYWRQRIGKMAECV